MPNGAPVSTSALRAASILIVDDEEANVRLLTRILARAGFTHVTSTTDPRDVLRLHQEIAPDLIVLDIHMPGRTGFEVLSELREVSAPTEFLPILAVTGDHSAETRQRALVAGAKDFLAKPFEASEVVVRVENLLTTRLLHRSLQKQNDVLEQKVRERTAELESALAAAEAASVAKSQFLATVSHELRTPLNAVIGFSSQLQKNKVGNLLPRDLEFLQRIGDNGRNLLQIINDILDLSRIEAGKLVVESGPVQLGRLVSDVLDQVVSAQPGFADRVETRTSLPPNLQSLVTDDSKLGRILLNLIGNATKFTQHGYVQVGVCADADGRPVRLDVIDTGIGIPADRLRAIFETFEQGDNSTQRRFGGTGLGLAISRTLCNLLGYRLAVVSDVGSGSAFSLLFDPGARPPSSYASVVASYDEAAASCL